jgi:hypothetical protein
LDADNAVLFLPGRMSLGWTGFMGPDAALSNIRALLHFIAADLGRLIFTVLNRQVNHVAIKRI